MLEDLSGHRNGFIGNDEELVVLKEQNHRSANLVLGLQGFTSGLKGQVVLLLCCYLVAKLCPTFCDSINSSPSGSSVHGVLQARILEWVAISSSRGSF